jgi:hypothetical protein
MKIKKGDKILVSGEATQVFEVLEVTNNSIILDTGYAEPFEKCTVIPEKYHKHIYTIKASYIDPISMMKILNLQE